MKRFHWIILAALSLTVLIPYSVHAAVSSFGGQIIPDVCNCIGSFSSPDHTTTVQTSAPDWGCVLQTIQSLINFIVYFATIIITVFIAWAGYTYMTSGGNPEKRSLANKRIMNAVIGLLIVLTAWLLVDSIMKFFYNPAGTTFAFGPWNSILADTKGNDNCFFPTSKPPPLSITAQTGTQPAAGSSPAGTGSAPANPPLAANGTGSCSASTVQTDAASGGYNLSNAQAQELACVAQYESTCGTARGPYNLNYSWDKANSKGYASTAAGAYQVLLSTNSTCYDNAPCEQAGGTPGVPLSCHTGFTNQGFTIPGSQVVQRCEQAAGNVACSASAAACQMQHQSFASMYGADPHAASCEQPGG